MSTAVLIEAFEVPVEADERFVAGWKPSPEATLHRALRRDVDFRFVAVGGGEPSGAEFPSHRGLYEVVHEDGTPQGVGGVVLINPFEVPDGADEEFLGVCSGAAGW